MTYPLTVTDAPCAEHKDCTATTYSNRLGVIGTRHLHQWLDPLGAHDLDGRDPEDLVFGTIQLGILTDYDEATGEAVFDTSAEVWTSSSMHHSVDPATRLHDPVYCVADDHRDGPGPDGKFPKLVGEGMTLKSLAFGDR